MRIDILTLFPGMFSGFSAEGVIRRALEIKALQLHLWDIRRFATDSYKSADDYPFGGGAGMLLKPEPLFRAFRSVLPDGVTQPHVIHLSPCGERLTQQKAHLLANKERLVMLCGHYEGIDQRVIDSFVDEEISVGDYILSGGELPAMVLADAVVRLLPGVLGSAESAVTESFEDGLLEYPQYTRPAEFEGRGVPPVLLQGNHGAIAAWRRQESLKRTLLRRPDMLLKMKLNVKDRQMLKQLMNQ